MSWRSGVALTGAFLAIAAPAAAAAPRLRGGGFFTAPVQVGAPVGDQRLFVVERAGKVRILGADGTLARKPFLDVSKEVVTGDEQGLEGLAFAPDYATSGEFFVSLTVKPKGQIQVRRYQVSASDPNRADAASGGTLLRLDKREYPNHNGGGLRFGPDGKLWLSVGDAGISDDNYRHAQDLTQLYGKLLRLERDGSPAAGNPFLGATDGSRPEIWQYGLRNVFRFSFDRATGDLVIGDVGESSREEIDLAPAAQGRLPGANWGWRCREGTLAVADCDARGAVDPVLELDHERDNARAVVPGVVVRDPGLPTLAGRLLYSDLGFNRLHSFALATDKDRVLGGFTVTAVVSIDEDGCGRPVVSSYAGRVARVVEGRLSTCAKALSGGVASPYAITETPKVPGVAACGLSLGAKPAKADLRVHVAVRARCRLVLRAGAAPRTLRLLPGASRTVRLPAAAGHTVTLSARATQGARTGRRTLTVKRG